MVKYFLTETVLVTFRCKKGISDHMKMAATKNNVHVKTKVGVNIFCIRGFIYLARNHPHAET